MVGLVTGRMMSWSGLVSGAGLGETESSKCLSFQVVSIVSVPFEYAILVEEDWP